LILAGGAGSALAQTTAALGIGATVSLDGFTGKITSLTCPLNGCTAGDQLAVVAGGSNNLTFEIINATPTSSIFASTGATETLSFTLSIAPTVGYTHRLGQAASVTQTAIGWQQYTSCTNCSGTSAKASSAFSVPVSTTPLLDTLAVQGKGTSPTQQTVTSSADPITTPTNSFNITSTLSLTPSTRTVGRLEFDALALRLRTVPEPAAIGLMLVGLGGLLAARSRRAPWHAGKSASVTPTNTPILGS
jgi:hypothetical protein